MIKLYAFIAFALQVFQLVDVTGYISERKHLDIRSTNFSALIFDRRTIDYSYYIQNASKKVKF